MRFVSAGGDTVPLFFIFRLVSFVGLVGLALDRPFVLKDAAPAAEITAPKDAFLYGY